MDEGSDGGGAGPHPAAQEVPLPQKILQKIHTPWYKYTFLSVPSILFGSFQFLRFSRFLFLTRSFLFLSLDQLKAELLCSPPPPDLNHMFNHRPLGTRTSEVHHNQRNRRQHSLSLRLVDEQHQRLPQRHSSLRGALDYYNSTTLPRVQKKKEEGGGYLLRKEGGRSAVPPPCPVHREAARQSAGESAAGDTEEYAAVTDGKNFLPVKNGEKYAAGKDVENFLPAKDGNKYAAAVEDGENFLQVDNFHPVKNADNYAAATDVENFLRVKEQEQLATQRAGEQQPAQSDAVSRYPPPRTEVRRQLSLRESCGTVRLVDRHGSVREVRKYSTLREGDRYAAAAAALRDVDKYATIRGGCYYGSYTTGTHLWEPGRISGFKLQPAMAAAAAVTASRQAGHPTTANGVTAGDEEAVVKSPIAAQEGEKSLTR